jgi:hypothetical protein
MKFTIGDIAIGQNIGDIAIGQNFTLLTNRNSMECEVIGNERLVTTKDVVNGDIDTEYRYRVRWADGKELWVRKENLHKKYDGNEPSTWEEFRKEVNWQPNTLRVNSEPTTDPSEGRSPETSTNARVEKNVR